MYGCDKGDTIGGCSTSKDCPHPTLYKCDVSRNACVELNPPHCTNDKKDSNETDIDCGGGACEACELGKKCTVNADCQSNKCDKNTLTCISVRCDSDKDCEENGHSCDEDSGVCNTCSDKTKNGDETDVDCGGPCGGCAIDKDCNEDDDCISGNCGEGNRCEAEKCADNDDCKDSQLCFEGACISCNDGVMNGNETAIDCGGPDCSKCGLGKGCKEDNDCDTGLICSGETCAKKGEEPVDTCKNNKKDDDESDVDCGGASICGGCKEGKNCTENDDCASGLSCINSKCAVYVDPCTNGVKDADESDIDCGGSSKCGLCDVDKACGQDSDCKSWNCTSAKLCANGECTSAAPGEVIINEVFTNPKTSDDLYHSSSKQMKYIELYNTTSEKRFLKDMRIDVDIEGQKKTVSMTGCIDKKTYLVLYPNGQTLSALDIDAKSAANADVDAAISSAKAGTIKLINRGSGQLIHGASLPDMSSKAGVSAAHKDSPEKDGELEKFVAHDSIPAEGGIANPHTPGLSNKTGIPQG